MDACVVFMFGPERAIAISDFFDCASCAFHKLAEALRVVEIHEREIFVWQDQGCATVDNVMDQYFALAKAITKRFNFVCCSDRKIVVGQPDARAFPLLEFREQVCNVEPRADVEIWFIERKKELEDGASRPRIKVEIVRHADGLYLILVGE